MSIDAIDHIQFAMPAGEEEAARKFYSGLLGVPEVPKPSELARRDGVWFKNGRVKIHLGVEAEFRPARKAHAGFVVRGLEAMVHTLRDAGIEVVEVEPRPEARHVYLNDPFGNRIELIEPAEP